MYIDRVAVSKILAFCIAGFSLFHSAPAKANSTCISEITKTPGSIGELGDCIPHRIQINLVYGAQYKKLMFAAIAAGANKKDYDTAIIDFKKAQNISGPKDTEVERGILGALAAKASTLSAQGTLTCSPSDPGYRTWLLISGERNDDH